MIHQPFWNYQNKDNQNLGRTFHGIVGCGYGGGLKPGDAPKGERIVTSTRSHSTGLKNNTFPTDLGSGNSIPTPQIRRE